MTWSDFHNKGHTDFKSRTESTVGEGEAEAAAREKLLQEGEGGLDQGRTDAVEGESNWDIYLYISISIYLSICLSMYLSICHLSIYVSIYLNS